MAQAMRVLHVVGKLNIGGAESRVMDLYRNINRDEIQFDFMQHTSEKCAFQDEVEALGGHVYHVPRFRVYNIFAYKKAWKKFFIEHPEIKIVHGHMTSTAAIYLPIAKKVGKCYTIAHARSAGVDQGIKGTFTRFLRRNLSKKCDQCFTCSDLAGVAVFGKDAVAQNKVKMIPNAIDVSKFDYNIEMRKKMRDKLGINDDAFVIGHVGRFDTVKNHSYMLQILQSCLEINKENKKYSDVKMLFLGDGPLMQEIKSKAGKLNILDNIIFAGNQKNIQDYYQAFDYFILPSFYEGLPGTAIEAQASGLSGLLSDKITSEAIVTENMKLMSITAPSMDWAREIMNVDIEKRVSMVTEVRQAGFDVKEQAKKMSDFYKEVSNS